MIAILTLKNINKAIMDQITEGLTTSKYNTVGFSSTDIKEKITRPSFYIEFYQNKTGKFNNNNKERTLETKIYYFAKDFREYKIELMEIQDFLENIFLEYLKASDNDNIAYNIPVNEIDFEIDKQQGFLTASIELYTIELIPDNDDSELMDTLDINI